MPSDLTLRRKLTLRAPDATGALRQVVFVKKPVESIEHVLMKAVVWALYLPHYPDLSVEIAIGDTYKPDVVALAPPPGGLAFGDPRPVFWGEAGKVAEAKWRSLFRRYPETHFAVAKWGGTLDPHVRILERAREGTRATGPVDLLRVPPDAADRLILSDGTVQVSPEDVARVRLHASREATG